MVGDILFGLGADGGVYMNRDGTLAGWKDGGGPVDWIYTTGGVRACPGWREWAARWGSTTSRAGHGEVFTITPHSEQGVLERFC
jgi:hypothetical protein